MSVLCVTGHITQWCHYYVLQVTPLCDVSIVCCRSLHLVMCCVLYVTPPGDVSIVCCRSYHLVMLVLYVAGHTTWWCQYCMLQVTPSSDVSIVCCRSHHLVMSVLFVAGNTTHHSATQGPRLWATWRERTTGSHDHWLCSQEWPHNGIRYRGLSHVCYCVSLFFFNCMK